MKAEQLYDMLAEVDWEMCPSDIGTLSAVCFRHLTDFKETNMLRPHYDTPVGTTMVNVRGVVKIGGEYIREPVRRKRRAPLHHLE